MFLCVLPGHVAGLTHPASLLFAVAAAGLADVKPTVQALTFAADQELKRLQTADAVKLSQAGLVPQQLSLGVFSLNLGFQLPEEEEEEEEKSFIRAVSQNYKRITLL